MNTFMQKLGVFVASLLTFLSASAYDFDFEVDGIYYNITDPTAKEVEVTLGTNKYSGDIVVPSSVSYDNEEYSVASIGNNAFDFCRSLTSIALPNSLITIGEFAFNGCSSLTSITLPKSLITIGEYAFNNCGLTTTTIPNSVTTIENGAFCQCYSLTSITIPNSVTAIGDDTFSGCKSLKSIDVDIDNQTYSSNEGILYNKPQTSLIRCPEGKSGEVFIPNSVTTIGKYAFFYCDDLTSIALPNSVTTIGNDAFYYCDDLTAITLPNSVTTIGDDAFSGCQRLKSIDVDADNQTYSSNEGILYNKSQTSLIRCPEGKSGEVFIPNSVTAIGEYAFYWCYSLTSITLPNSVTILGEGAFNCCENLTTITLSNSLTTIGEGAFWRCSSLTSITLPNSVTTIELWAFSWCSSLTSLTSLAVTPPACGRDPFDYIDKEKCTLYVPARSVEAYKQAYGWKDFVQVEAVEAGIDSVVAGSADGATEVFNLTGAKVADTLVNLPAGIYLVREGSTVRKIAVR